MTDDETALLQRALKRERARRAKAEQLLEDKSRELFHSYQSLQESHDQLGDALEEVKRQQKQLVQSEKLASLGTMSAGVAHEINNPLAFVFSNVNSLAHAVDQFRDYHQHVGAVVGADSGDQQQQASEALEAFIDEADIEFLFEDCGDLLKETVEGIQRVKAIVAGLKAFARSDTGEMEDVDIVECIRNTLKLSHNQIKFTMEVIEEFEDLPLIKGFPGKLSQVFLNLIVNAGQAMKDGTGSITITTKNLPESIELQFRDTGSGMTAETIKDIFNPFFTTKPVGEGTGLGLSISHGIIEEHAGEITVTSEVGVGTCFSISLPKPEMKAAA